MRKGSFPELFRHNQEAYEAAERMLGEHGRAAVIHPTGTGKSFIGFRLAWEHPGEGILWLSPSEYIYRTQVENLKKAIPGTAGEREAAAGEITRNITFCTYSRLMHATACGGMDEGARPGYIVLDEFHRCGAAEWGKGVDRLIRACPKAKVLGLSATGIRYLDGQRDMAEELFGGLVASEMTLGEAIAGGILPAPEYVISMYSYREELSRLAGSVKGIRDVGLREEDERLLEELRRALENAEGLDIVFQRHMRPGGKYIVFCSGKAHMEEMASHAGEWFRLVDGEPHIYRAYYGSPGTGREFAGFKEDRSGHLALLYCIDMLNEGVHVDGIDGVVLLRPTASPTLYLQQVGRALAAGGGPAIPDAGRDAAADGSGVRPRCGQPPAIFDIVDNFDGLRSIDTLRREVEAALPAAAGGAGDVPGRFLGSFHISDELRDCREIFAQLERSLTAAWDIYYKEAEAYYREHKNLWMPNSYRTPSGLSLGAWLNTQRRVRAGKAPGRLSEGQAARLDAIGMEWADGPERKWERAYRELVAYREEHGDVDVNVKYVSGSGFPLGKWVSNVRAKHRRGGGGRGGLTAEQAGQLDSLGMAWDGFDARWEANFRAAERYWEENGNLRVPHGYVTGDGIRLGTWILNQRCIRDGTRRGSAPLTDAQVARLDAIGMEWGSRKAGAWEEKYGLARRYYLEHGDLEVPAGYCVGGVRLGRWVCSLRSARRSGTPGRALTEERVGQLDAIGMRWD